MTHADDHKPTKTPAVTGVVVARPRETDAIGRALACAFETSRGVPPELSLALGKLDSIQ